MDGVIANFNKAAEEGGWTHRPDKHVNYRKTSQRIRLFY